jgi:hypothetical protein
MSGFAGRAKHSVFELFDEGIAYDSESLSFWRWFDKFLPLTANYCNTIFFISIVLPLVLIRFIK